MNRHSKRAAKALRHLVEHDPALGALSLWCGHEDSGSLDLSATSDATTVTYGPSFEALRADEQIGLAAHHILHVAFRHTARSKAMQDRQGVGFDADLFALAADAILNQSLVMAGYALPRPAVLLDDVLQERLQEETDDALANWGVERLYLALQANGGPAKSGRSGTDFQPDFTPSDKAEEGDDAAAWQQRLASAMEAGRLAGVGIGRLAGVLSPAVETRIPWETLLRTQLLKALSFAPRRDFARPARRWMALSHYAESEGQGDLPMEPGLSRKNRRPRLGVALDMSGSISDRHLDRFAAQIAMIARRTGAELHVMTFDVEVRATEVVDISDVGPRLGQLSVQRDGGTDFRPVLKAADARDLAGLVILTDLEGPVGKPPRCPVIWASEGPAPNPPFGTLVRLDL